MLFDSQQFRQEMVVQLTHKRDTLVFFCSLGQTISANNYLWLSLRIGHKEVFEPITILALHVPKLEILA